MSTHAAVKLAHIPGRGRGLITARDVCAGEIVLAEEPLLLTVSQEFKDQACANCLCWLSERCSGAVRCQECHQAAFCSPACQQQAAQRPWVHAAATCRAYAAMPQLIPGDVEQQNYLRFLIQAAAIKAAAATAAAGGGAGSGMAQQCAAAYQVMLSLVGEPTASTTATAAVLHPALCTAIGDASGQLLSAAEVAALLAKEQLNCFGLLAPLHLQQQKAAGAEDADADDGSSSRRLRGGALYPICALLNHECIPNVARFDALDAAVGGAWPAQWTAAGQQQQQAAALVAAVAGSDATAVAALAAAAGLSAGPHGSSSGAGACGCGSSGGCGGSSTTQVTMRALHGLPAGTEVVLSYVPLNWDLSERQHQTQRVYGFTCICPRCLLEASPEWQAGQEGDSSDGDWETDSGDGASAEAADDAPLDSSPAAGAAAAGMEEDHVLPDQPHMQQVQLPQQQQQQQQEPMEPGYLSIFLLKYMCPKEGCFGTMAAVQGSSSGACECSVCGTLRSEAEFLAELEQQ